jgi:methylmalonyl-CoA mutase
MPLLPTAIESEKKELSKIKFSKSLLNQFDKKMDLDPYNWEIILTWNEK